MTKVDDLNTFFSMSLTCRYMARCARKYRKKKMEDLEGILPPIYLCHTLDRLMEHGDLENVLNSNHNYGVVIRYGDICFAKFEKPGTLEFAGARIFVSVGTYMLPMFLSDYNEIRANRV